MREEGYYWVKYNGKWMIAEFWRSGLWWLTGALPHYNEEDFEEIDEKRLTHE